MCLFLVEKEQPFECKGNSHTYNLFEVLLIILPFENCLEVDFSKLLHDASAFCGEPPKSENGGKIQEVVMRMCMHTCILPAGNLKL